MIKKPVYTFDAAWASDHDELNEWRESRRLNRECARAVEDVIRRHFDGMHLSGQAVRESVDECGAERVEYVLASTLQMKRLDGRFSKANIDWAMSYWIPTGNFPSCVESHPAVLNGFVSQFLKLNYAVA